MPLGRGGIGVAERKDVIPIAKLRRVVVDYVDEKTDMSFISHFFQFLNPLVEGGEEVCFPVAMTEHGFNPGFAGMELLARSVPLICSDRCGVFPVGKQRSDGGSV